MNKSTWVLVVSGVLLVLIVFLVARLTRKGG